MKRILFGLFSVLVCAGAYAQKDKAPLIKWHDNTYENFLSIPIVYDEKGKFYYNLSNDAENFYVLLKVFDKDVQRQVLGSGFTIWINMEGKKGTKTGFRFPARERGPRPEGGGKANQPMQTGQPEGNRSGWQGEMAGSQNMMGGRNPNSYQGQQKIEAIGLTGKSNEFFPADGTSGYKGTIKIQNDGNMFLQIIIPLSKMPPMPSDPKKGANGMMIGISHPGIPVGMGMGMPGGGGFDQGGGPGGGGGGRGMGGPGGGRSGGGRGGSSSFSGGSSSVAPFILWLKDVRFASQQ